MIIENSPVGSSKSNWIIAIPSVQGMIRTVRIETEERWRVEIDATHSVWPWIAEHAGFLLTRFEVGRWENCVGTMERRVDTGAGHDVRLRVVEEEACGRPSWKIDVHVGGWRVLGCQGDHRRVVHRGIPKSRMAQGEQV